MKPIIKLLLSYAAIFILACMKPFPIKAQENETFIKKIYADVGSGYGLGHMSSLHTNLQFILKNDWSFSLSYYDHNMDPKNLPNNYLPMVWIINGENQVISHRQSDLKLYNFTAGKYILISKQLWLTSEAGISILSGMRFRYEKVEIERISWNNGYSFIGSNYKESIKDEPITAGLMLKTDLTWAFLPFLGIGIGVYTNLNTVQIPAGIHFRIIVGWLPRSKK